MDIYLPARRRRAAGALLGSRHLAWPAGGGVRSGRFRSVSRAPLPHSEPESRAAACARACSRPGRPGRTEAAPGDEDGHVSSPGPAGPRSAPPIALL